MALTREEFLRLLPAAVGPFTVDGEAIGPAGGDGGWAIRLGSLPHQRLGGVAVPRLGVDISVDAASATEAEAFMGRFRRAFLRGGG